MQNDIRRRIEESEKLEKNIADIYLIFSERFQRHSVFWITLSIEEKNHAELFRTALANFIPLEYFPEEILCPSLEDLIDSNSEIEKIKENDEEFSIQDACNLALRFEDMTGEFYYKLAMTAPAKSETMKVFKELNDDEIDHAKRILTLMKEGGIKKTYNFKNLKIDS